MTTHPTRPTIEQTLASLDADTAGEARAALDWLLPDGGTWEDLTQLGLQSFLWYELPMKWLTEERHHHEVAWALADAFDRAGMARYAGLCRSEATHRLLGRWEPEREPARAEFRRLMKNSGVDPPDTDLLTWGAIQGMEEHAASWRVSIALEMAIDNGVLVPGQRGWRMVAARITRETLLEPAGDGGGGNHATGRSLVEQVEAERCEDWLREARHRGLRVSEDLAAVLTAGWPTDDGVLSRVAETLDPLRWFLAEIGDGLTLTQAGYLPKAMALAADARFDWFDLKPQFTVRGERDLPELSDLRELARAQRLVTVRGRRLTLSARGRAALEDGSAQVGAVLGHAFGPRTWLGETAAAVAATMLAAPDEPALEKNEVDAAVLAYLSTAWRRGAEPLTDRDAGMAAWDVLRLSEVFGWTVKERRDWRLAPRLTHVGRLAFMAGLRLQAAAPRAR